MSRALAKGDLLEGRYEIVTKIGVGGFGSVYSAEDTAKKENQLVAIKQLNYGWRYFKKDFKREVKIMKNLDNPNVIRMFDSFEKGNSGFMVMEVALCDLTDFQLKSRGFEFNKNCIMSVMHSICSGLAYLHIERRIIFIDLKPDNVLIMPNGNVKLSDFGCAQEMNDNGMPENPKSDCTQDYMAPEMAEFDLDLCDEYDAKLDIFSFGSSVIKILVGKTPNDKVLGTDGYDDLEPLTVQKDFFGILSEELNKSKLKIDDEAMELVKKCLSKNPEDRPTAKECYELIEENLFSKIKSGAQKMEDIARNICVEPQTYKIGSDSIISIENEENKFSISLGSQISLDSQIIKSLHSGDFDSMKIVAMKSMFAIQIFRNETRLRTLCFSKSGKSPKMNQLDDAFKTRFNGTYSLITSDGIYTPFEHGRYVQKPRHIKSVIIDRLNDKDRTYKVKVGV